MSNSSCGLACLKFIAVLRLLGVMADFLYGDGRWPAFFSIFVITKSRSSIRTESKVASTTQSSISPRVSNAANINSLEENGSRPNQSIIRIRCGNWIHSLLERGITTCILSHFNPLVACDDCFPFYGCNLPFHEMQACAS